VGQADPPNQPTTVGNSVPQPLQGSTVPLVERYDVALLDLDGVIYVGHDPVPGAADALTRARSRGIRLAFVTNNASRTPVEVASLLGKVGVRAETDEIVTSAQAAARVLAEKLPAGARVLVVGADALRQEVTGRGLAVVASADEEPDAVVQGYAPDTSWRDLAEATVAVRRGAWWVATNIDTTLPSARGALPGNGALVGVVTAATGARPLVTGKPEPALHRESVDRTGARSPLVVGDRLDTDIEGANAAGSASMLVLTGVTGADELLAAEAVHRPTYLAADLTGLVTPHPAPQREAGGGWRCGGWQVSAADDGAVVLSGTGPDRLDALRALCAAAWEAGRPPRLRPDGAAAIEVAAGFGLTGG
jgi:HAD superfamily hydrolase (TIGR01450 family)